MGPGKLDQDRVRTYYVSGERHGDRLAGPDGNFTATHRDDNSVTHGQALRGTRQGRAETEGRHSTRAERRVEAAVRVEAGHRNSRLRSIDGGQHKVPCRCDRPPK